MKTSVAFCSRIQQTGNVPVDDVGEPNSRSRDAQVIDQGERKETCLSTSTTATNAVNATTQRDVADMQRAEHEVKLTYMKAENDRKAKEHETKLKILEIKLSIEKEKLKQLHNTNLSII